MHGWHFACDRAAECVGVPSEVTNAASSTSQPTSTRVRADRGTDFESTRSDGCPALAGTTCFTERPAANVGDLDLPPLHERALCTAASMRVS